MPITDLEARKAYQKAYHQKWYADPENAAAKKENAKVHRKLAKERNREYLREYKGSRGCQRCPENDPVCIDFHHRSDKRFDVSRMLLHGLETINAEIAKCDLLCRNCHAKLHGYGRRV